MKNRLLQRASKRNAALLACATVLLLALNSARLPAQSAATTTPVPYAVQSATTANVVVNWMPQNDPQASEVQQALITAKHLCYPQIVAAGGPDSNPRIPQQRILALQHQLSALRSRLTSHTLTSQARAELERTAQTVRARIALEEANIAAQRAAQAERNIQQSYSLSQTEPQYQLQSRNLLYTQADAARVKVIHPLVTPEVQARVTPLKSK